MFNKDGPGHSTKTVNSAKTATGANDRSPPQGKRSPASYESTIAMGVPLEVKLARLVSMTKGAARLKLVSDDEVDDSIVVKVKIVMTVRADDHVNRRVDDLRVSRMRQRQHSDSGCTRCQSVGAQPALQ